MPDNNERSTKPLPDDGTSEDARIVPYSHDASRQQIGKGERVVRSNFYVPKGVFRDATERICPTGKTRFDPLAERR
jgi:hypothetical protein